MDTKLKEEMDLIDNLIFPSKEDDGIEHVDESYEGFKATFSGALVRMYDAGYANCSKSHPYL